MHRLMQRLGPSPLSKKRKKKAYLSYLVIFTEVTNLHPDFFVGDSLEQEGSRLLDSELVMFSVYFFKNYKINSQISI
jgi:hypothetical protein